MKTKTVEENEKIINGGYLNGYGEKERKGSKRVNGNGGLEKK